MKKYRVAFKFAVALVLAVAVASGWTNSLSAQEPDWKPLYEGVDVVSYSVAEPLMKIVAARIDLQAPGVEFKTTESNPNFKKEERETVRRTVAEFLNDRSLSLAVNANFYTPFNASTIVKEGDSNLTGLAVSDGFVLSEPADTFPSFVVKNDGSVEIKQYSPGDDLSDVKVAVSGNQIVLKDGEILALADKAVHPRTAVGISRDSRYVYLATIDGRQPKFSVGATYEQVASALKYLGAWQGLNLDGGGSTTFVVRGADDKPVLLNRPCNPTLDRMRHNGNGLGVIANGAPQTDPTEFRLK